MAKSNFIVRGGADFSNITKEITKTQSQFKSFQTGLTKTLKGVAIALGSIAVGTLIKDSTKMAMSVESSIDNIKRNMEKSAGTFNNWVATQSRVLGMGKAEAYKYGSTFSNLLDSFTSDAQTTATETEKLMKAAAIISSKTGRSYDDVSERIRSGMMGSTEAIEDLGVYTQISMLESTDAFKKFANGKSWAQLDFQVQQQIRLAAILEQTFERYGDTLADTTQTRQAQFLASLKNIQLNIGQAFLPIYNAVLPALTALMNKIEAVTSTFASFTQAIFGKAKVSPAQETEDHASAMTDLGDATEKAGKQAKGALAGFDEINSLADNGGSGAANTASVAKSDTTAATGDSRISPEVQKMAENLKNIFEPVTTAFENLKTTAEPLINTIGTGLKSFYDTVLVPYGSWVTSEAIPSFMNLLSGAFAVINPLLQSFQPLGNWLWTNFLQPIASWTGEVFIASVNGVADALKTIGDWMTKNKPIVEAITTTTVAFIAAWKLTELLAFIQMSGGIVTAFSSIKSAIAACTVAKIADKVETIALTAMYAKDFVVSIASSTAALIGNAAQWVAATAAMIGNKVALVASTIAQGAMTAATVAWNVVCGIGTALTTAFGVAMAILTSPITLVIAAIALLVAGVYLLIKHWDDVKNAASVAWNWIVGVWKIASGWFDTNVIKPITGFFTGLWDGIKNGVTSAWNKAVEIFQGASKWFSDNVTTPISTAFDTAWGGIKEGFKKAFDYIAEKFGPYINGFIIIVEGFTNAFIKGINFIIRALNKVNFSVPDWVPVIGGKSFGINLSEISEIKIPRLATGGITNGEMIATIGDNPGGREVVSPLDDLLDMISSAVGTAMMNASQFSSSNNSGNKEIVLELNGTRLGRAILPEINREVERLGYKPLLQMG